MSRRTLGILVAALVVVGVAGGLGYRSAQGTVDVEPPETLPVTRGDVQRSVTAPGTAIDEREKQLVSSASGIVAPVHVLPGESVRQGEVVLEMQNKGELRAAVAEAEAALAQARQALEDLIASAPLRTAEAQVALVEAREALRTAERQRTVQQEGNRALPETLKAAEAKLAVERERMERARSVYDHTPGERSDGGEKAETYLAYNNARIAYNLALAAYNWYTGHPTELQQAQLDASVAVAAAQVELAERAYERLRDGPDPDALAEAEAEVALAEARLDQAKAALDGAALRAPFDGVVLEVSVAAGDRVAAGAPTILLGDPRALEVQVEVIEEDLPLLEAGQVVQLYFDALPDAVIEGQVARIVPRRTSGDRPIYPVYISLDEVPEGLVAGMTADASIIIEARSNVLRLPRALVRARSDGTANVQVWAGDHLEERAVQVGLRGDTYVEILSGLSEGEQVVAE